jgi:hypothetical protein
LSRSRLVPLANDFGVLTVFSLSLALSFAPEPEAELEGRATTRFTAVVANASGIILVFPRGIDAGMANGRKRRRGSMAVTTIVARLSERGRTWPT